MLIEKVNESVNSGINDRSVSLDMLLEFLKNASTQFILNQINFENKKLSSLNVSRVLTRAVDNILSHIDEWKEKESNAREKSLTKLLDLVDETIFDRSPSQDDIIIIDKHLSNAL